VTRLVRLRENTLVLLDDQGKPHVELRPYYSAGTGPAVEFYRVSETAPEYQFTLRLNTINELVRKLPIVLSAARRLQNTREPAR
jgi:hypothetical protein